VRAIAEGLPQSFGIKEHPSTDILRSEITTKCAEEWSAIALPEFSTGAGNCQSDIDLQSKTFSLTLSDNFGYDLMQGEGPNARR